MIDLFSACERGDVASVEACVVAAEHAHAQTNESGATPLWVAVNSRHAECADVLLRHCAKLHHDGAVSCVVNLCDGQSRSPLFTALSSTDDASLVMVHALLAHESIDVMCASAFGVTPLHLAAATHLSVPLCCALLAKLASANAATTRGQTPLHWIMQCVSQVNVAQVLAVVQTLLDAGADPRIADSSGATPLSLVSDEASPIRQLMLESVNKRVEQQQHQQQQHDQLREQPEVLRSGARVLVAAGTGGIKAKKSLQIKLKS